MIEIPPMFPIGFDPSVDRSLLPTHVFEKGFKELGELYCFFFFATPGVAVGSFDAVRTIMNSKDYVMRQYPEIFDMFLHNRGILFTNNLPHWKKTPPCCCSNNDENGTSSKVCGLYGQIN